MYGGLFLSARWPASHDSTTMNIFSETHYLNEIDMASPFQTAKQFIDLMNRYYCNAAPVLALPAAIHQP